MPTIDHHTPGTFCWFELATTDQQAAKEFYHSLFGWASEDSPIGPNEFYTSFKLHHRDVAAGYTMRPEQRASGVPPNWMVYIAVANADQAALRITELGGKTMMAPFDVMEHGRMVVAEDPTGAMFSVWQPKKHAGTGLVREHNTITWADLNTPDQSRAASFYSHLFGWKMSAGKDKGEPNPGDYYHIMAGHDFIGGIPGNEYRDPNAPPNWMIYVTVADCRATTHQAKSLGGRVYVEPTSIGGEGSFSIIADPQGAVIGLHQR